MAQFITDRSQYHIELLKRLRKKRWVDMTSSERDLWYGEAAKGAYNHMDLNRVETAVAELANKFSLTLTTKTNWTVWDIPLATDMSRYLSNVVAIRNHCATLGSVSNFPTLPTNMNALSLEGANNIEKVLELAYGFAVSSEIGKFEIGKSTLGSV